MTPKMKYLFIFLSTEDGFCNSNCPLLLRLMQLALAEVFFCKGCRVGGMQVGGEVRTQEMDIMQTYDPLFLLGFL